MKDFVIAIDEGTTSVRTAVISLSQKKIIKTFSSEIKQYFPEETFVEEDAEEIYEKTLLNLYLAINFVGESNVLSIGITNQRETIVPFYKKDGKPVYNAIVWQCKRTSEYAEKLRKEKGEFIYKKTGLICDSYFSATKIKWLLDNDKKTKAAYDMGEIYFGTIDTYLLYRLTGNKEFKTDITNASRTMLFNIKTLCWDDELLEFFGINKSVLPAVYPSSSNFGYYDFGKVSIPITAMAGDQQASLFGQNRLNEGEAKITFGTGLFMLMNVGDKIPDKEGKVLITPTATADGKTCYALEGSVYNAGSALEFLKKSFGFFGDMKEMEKLAKEVEDTKGVYVVPAFSGLGSPYWIGEAKAGVFGLTLATDKRYVIKSTLESMAFFSKDLIDEMEEFSGRKLTSVTVDGGVSKSEVMLSFLADVLGVDVIKNESSECTALGVALLAALYMGAIKKEDLNSFVSIGKIYKPTSDREKINKKIIGWKNAVKKVIEDI